MRTLSLRPRAPLRCAGILALSVLVRVHAVETVFFDASQSTNRVHTTATTDTLYSEGYAFTYTRDYLFTGGVGLTNAIGRTERVHWPDGLEAQAVTTGPQTSGARLVVRRVDGQPFDIPAFTVRLLANTAGAGGSVEVMPLRNGEDGFPDPLALGASGYAGSTFHYITPQLTGFDAYQISLYVDFAVMSLTAVDASLPPPVLSATWEAGQTWSLSWPASAAGFQVERNDHPPAGAWLPVAAPVVVQGDTQLVVVAVESPSAWFRLRKP